MNDFKFLRTLDIYNTTSNTTNLFCFPYAGGGASAYIDWEEYLNKNTTVYRVQLPGREDRIIEKPIIKMKPLVNEIVMEIKEHMDKPIVFFGHSMGAKIAYEVALEIQSRTGVSIGYLIVSGSRAPHYKEPRPMCNLDDEAFINRLKEYSGIPEKILESRELIDFFLPTIRSDFILDETYDICKREPIDAPILALHSEKDIELKTEEVKAWATYTKNNFDIKKFEGDHFFIKTEKEKVLTCIGEVISAVDVKFKNGGDNEHYRKS